MVNLIQVVVEDVGDEENLGAEPNVEKGAENQGVENQGVENQGEEPDVEKDNI